VGKEWQRGVARLQDGEVLQEDCAQAPHELKEAVGGEVVLVEPALRPAAAARARLKARLLLLDPRPELLLQRVRRLVSRAREKVVPRGRREAGHDAHKLPRQVREVGLAEHALVPAAGLRDLRERGAVRLGVLRAYPPRQVRLLSRDQARGAKDASGLLQLRRVRELLLAIPADKDLNPVPVAALPERRGRLASYVLAPEEELRQGALRAK
jgi:hypothetical protein